MVNITDIESSTADAHLVDQETNTFPVQPQEDHTVGIALFTAFGIFLFFLIMGTAYCSYPRLFRCSYRPPRSAANAKNERFPRTDLQ